MAGSEVKLEDFGIDTTLPPPAQVPRVATFFALYPETLGLEPGTTFCIALNQPVRGFNRTAMHLTEGQEPFWLDPKLSEFLAVSARFHRGTRDKNFVVERDEMLMSIVGSVTGDSFPEFTRAPTRARPDEPEGASDYDVETARAYTVVEITTQLAIPETTHWQACEPNGYVMGPTLTRGIQGLIQIIDAYRFAEKIPMPSPARERLGPVIVAATRAADPAMGGWDAPAQYVINNFATQGARDFIVGTQQPDTLQKMTDYSRLAAKGHPSIVLGHLQAELDNAMFDGNFRVVLLFAYTASEMLMDLALMGMAFEEGQSAEESGARFAKPLKTRLLTEYHDRLGGAWSPQGSSDVAAWLRAVREVRNRVAHAGYLPDYDEAHQAREAHYSLGRHLRDRLACRASKYPFTAGLLVTPGGFERRSIRSKAAQDAVRVASDRFDEFLVWRDNAIRLRA